MLDSDLDAEAVSLTSLIDGRERCLQGFLRGRLGCDAAAQDAVQDTWLRLLQVGAREVVRAPVALMFHIAANVANDELRRRRRQAGETLDGEWTETLADPGATPEQVCIAQQELQMLKDAILDLPPRCREVFVLSRFHGLSYPQIADRCGISVKAVEKQISMALARCRARVDTHTAAHER